MHRQPRPFPSFRVPPLAIAGAAALLAMQTPARAAAWDAFLKGEFGPVVSWPVIPIHVALLPDGRVMSYGTDDQGGQGAQMGYDVWTPSRGTGGDAHLVLPNRTGTDIFCSGQIVLAGNGRLLLTGGDRTVLGVRNFAVPDVNVFDPRDDTLTSARQPMATQRWYPGMATLASGEVLVMGGMSDPGFYSSTPEVYSETGGWRTLTGATSQEAYGSQNWNYPRAWQAPNGKVFIAGKSGATFYLDTAGQGRVDKLPVTLPPGDPYLTSVMFAPGRILSLRQNNKAVVIDLNGFMPTVKNVTGPGQDRYHASLTVLPDGRVLLSGGSRVANEDNGVAYTARIWNPVGASWAPAASAAKMRLYHSTALLLPDGRVLTAGGGAPGPVKNLNAEIFSPPYLFQSDLLASRLAARPSINGAPATVTWGQNVLLGASAANIRRVTLIKTGSATHTADFDQRFIELKFTASGSTLNVSMPASANVAPPGHYLLFVINGAGVPSVARIVKLG